ncbi:carbohydrate ABC transporter permease [Novisyntrophococcus fermenticellae]|uniref:carbohydrate ABC transporter permease n=1 Tax=Novisyntrophococcus fermenticellae TaxID=2068655 RepID=UPI001E49D997|nr:carbohydrate ABC transporter permease [Novisyntrophococcus fermenticellae]
MGKTAKIIGHVIGNIVSVFISLVVIIPLVVLFVNSFKTSAEANRMTLSLPTEWVFENYATVIEQGKLVSSFLNGFLYATCSVVIIVIVVAAAAFVISRNQKGVNRFLYYFIISGIAMPINNVALMKVMQAFHIVNTRIGIILLYAAINIPLSLFLAYGFVETIPREIDEAAVIDGCKPWQLFVKVIVPLLKPIISTLFVLDFMAVWNDFTMPLYYLNNSRKWPMTLAVYNFFGAFENSWNLVAADIILTLAPVLLVFVLGQKYIVGGVSAGSVKG